MASWVAIGNHALGQQLLGARKLLKWNAEKVKNLSGTEIWLFILGRVLVAFGIGILTAYYYPQIAWPVGVPALVVGTVLFLIAAKALLRKS
jgi:hypothetical protein